MDNNKKFNGRGNQLGDNSAKLSSKNFDRLMKERGISEKDAQMLKDSFSGYRKGHDPNDIVTARHITKPEDAKNYNNGKWSSGNFQTKDNYNNSKDARNKLALPDKNDASKVTDTTINPRLNNGKQHNVIEGGIADQKKDDKNFSKNRPGGGRQIVTDGGFDSGAVTKGNTRDTNNNSNNNSRNRGIER